MLNNFAATIFTAIAELMRYLLPLLLFALLLANCGNKETRRCWNCDYTYGSATLPDSTGDTILCNFTQTDINLRSDIKFDAPGTDYDNWSITNCSKQ